MDIYTFAAEIPFFYRRIRSELRVLDRMLTDIESFRWGDESDLAAIEEYFVERLQQIVLRSFINPTHQKPVHFPFHDFIRSQSELGRWARKKSTDANFTEVTDPRYARFLNLRLSGDRSDRLAMDWIALVEGYETTVAREIAYWTTSEGGSGTLDESQIRAAAENIFKCRGWCCTWETKRVGTILMLSRSLTDSFQIKCRIEFLRRGPRSSQLEALVAIRDASNENIKETEGWTSFPLREVAAPASRFYFLQDGTPQRLIGTLIVAAKILDSMMI